MIDNVIEQCSEYQKTFVHNCLKQNTICYLPTSTGKMLISIEIIRNRLVNIREDIISGKIIEQKVVFCVPTRMAVSQSVKYLRSQLPKDIIVKECTRNTINNEGDGLDPYSMMGWTKKIEEADILVLVPEILKTLISSDLMTVSMLNCIILDEVHETRGKSPMTYICDVIKSSSSLLKPLIFGMTSNLILRKVDEESEISKDILTLQENTNCILQSSEELVMALEAIDSMIPKPQLSLLTYAPDGYQRSAFPSLGDGLSILSAIMNGNFTNVSSLFNEKELSFDMHPIHILIHSFIRVRHTDFIYHILKLKKNFKLSSKEIYELTQYHPGKPGVILMSNIRLDNTHYTNLSELEGMFGQIVGVTLNCGILCGINALKIVSKSIEDSDRKLSDVSMNEMGESIIDVSPLISLRYPEERKRNIDDTDSFKVNPDRLKHMSKELLDGLFEYDDLSQVDNCVLASLIDMFVALVLCCYNSYGKELLGFAVLSIFKKLLSWISNRIPILNKRIEEFVDIKTDFNVVDFDANISFEDLNTNSIKGRKRFVANIIEERIRHEDFTKEVVKLKAIEADILKIIEDSKGMTDLKYNQAKVLVKSMQHVSNPLAFVVLILLCGVNKSFRDDDIFKFKIGSCDTFENFYKFYESFLNSDDAPPLATSSISIYQLKVSIYDGCAALLENINSFKYLIDSNDPDINNNVEVREFFQESKDSQSEIRDLTIQNPINNGFGMIKMISNKLLSVLLVWSMIENDMSNDSNVEVYDWYSIIFCKMRLTAQTICNVLDLLAKIAIKSGDDNVLNSSSFILNLSKCRKVKPSCMFGSSSSEQSKLLSETNSKKFNVLCATDVVDEGLESNISKLVICFDISDNIKSFMQRRARARSQDSKMLFCCPEGIIGHRDILHLQNLQNQEKIMNSAVDSIDIKLLDKLIDDTIIFPYIEKPEESTSDSEHKLLCDDDYQAELSTSSQLLLQYCMQLQSQDYFKPQPLFWTVEVPNPNLNSPRLYQCSILLPTSVPPNARCILGPLNQSKSQAKHLASFQCIQNLIKCGEIAASSLQTRTLNERKLINCCDIKDSLGDSKATVTNKQKDNMIIEILVKAVPDLLALDAQTDQSTVEPLKLHLYAVRVLCTTTSSYVRVHTCHPCLGSIKGINSVGLALLSPIPNEVLDIKSSATLRTTEALSLQLEYLGEKIVEDKELYQMQRFHKGIVCWESEDKPIHSNAMDYINMFDYDHNIFNYDNAKPIDLKTWVKSSNGGFNMFFPLPPTVNLTPLTLDECKITETDRNFLFSSDWFDYLVKSANESQILIHNIRVQEKKYKMEALNETEAVIPIPMTSKHSKDQFPEMIITRGKFDMFMGIVEPHIEMDLSCISRLVSKSVFVTSGVIPPDYEYTTNREMFDDLHTAIKEGKFVGVTDNRSKGHNSNQDDYDNDDTNDKLDDSNDKLEPDQLIPMTFAFSFLKSNPAWGERLEKLLNEKHKLIPVVHVPPKLTLTTMFSVSDDKCDDKGCTHFTTDEKENKTFNQEETKTLASHPVQNIKRHNHIPVSYLIPECCEVMGPAKWFFAGLAAPNIIWRLQSLLLAAEARERIVDSVKEYYQNNHYNCSPKSFDVEKPSLPLMIQCLTPRAINEGADSERLEMLGDMLLKFVITVELFRIYPQRHEGFLTLQRSDYVNNQHLHGISKKLDLAKYLRACKLSTGRQLLNLRPAGASFTAFRRGLSLWNQKTTLYTRQFTTSDIRSSYEATLTSKKRRYYNPSDKDCRALDQLISKSRDAQGGAQDSVEVSKMVQRVNKIRFSDFSEVENLDEDDFYRLEYVEPLYVIRSVRSKLVSDSVEALIAAFFIAGGMRSVINVIKGLGSWPKVKSSTEGTDAAITQAVSHCVENPDLVVHKFEAPEVFIPEGYPPHLERLATVGYHTEESHIIAADETVIRNASGAISSTSIPNESNEMWLRRSDCFRLVECTKDSLIETFADLIGYKFKDFQLLDEALTHSSVTHKKSNQRLEFLGDAIIDFTIVVNTFHADPEGRFNQGAMTFRKVEVSNNKNLSRVACTLRLYRFINMTSVQLRKDFEEIETWFEKMLLKKNTVDTDEITEEVTAYIETMKVGVMKTIADTLEAIMGAVYIDSNGNLETMKHCINHIKLVQL